MRFGAKPHQTMLHYYFTLFDKINANKIRWNFKKIIDFWKNKTKSPKKGFSKNSQTLF